MRRAVTAGLAVVLAGCGADPEITAVRIFADFGGIEVDQLSFTLVVEGETAGNPLHRPANPGPALASPQDLVVYLDDRAAGKVARCQVRGRRGDREVATSEIAQVSVVLEKVVRCVARLQPVGASDGSAPRDPDAAVADGGVIGDAAPISDGKLVSDVALDLAPPRDAPPPGVDVPPTPDMAAPTPDTAPAPDVAAPPPPDAAPDTAAPPPDVPVDQAPPPDTMAPPNGCASGVRQAFLDPGLFPDVAGCGAAVMTYGQALTLAPTVCSTGWHWCKAEEVGGLPATPVPGLNSGTCSWLDSSVISCGDRRNSYMQAGCAGGAGATLSAGGPTGGSLACTGVDLGCAEPWKFAVSLDHWGTSSIRGASAGSCLDHVAFQCVAQLGTSCWITCCRN